MFLSGVLNVLLTCDVTDHPIGSYVVYRLHSLFFCSTNIQLPKLPEQRKYESQLVASYPPAINKTRRLTYTFIYTSIYINVYHIT